MSIQQTNEEELKNKLKFLLDKPEIALHQQLIKRLSADLQINYLDCASALSLLNHADLVVHGQGKKLNESEIKKVENNLVSIPKQKQVRYRLDIGRKHAVTQDDIKDVLIEVSGVDKKRIGRLDIRNYYTLVDLPDGMPADIFQLLAEVEIKQRKLNLKRVKYQPRFYRRQNKQQVNKKL